MDPNDPKEIVLSYLKTLEDQDFKDARDLIHEDFMFNGPLASISNPEELFIILRRLKSKYAVRRIFADRNDVCVLYDLTVDALKISVFTCGLFHIRDFKITSIRTIFDPRPFVAMSEETHQEM